MLSSDEERQCSRDVLLSWWCGPSSSNGYGEPRTTENGGWGWDVYGEGGKRGWAAETKQCLLSVLQITLGVLMATYSGKSSFV